MNTPTSSQSRFPIAPTRPCWTAFDVQRLLPGDWWMQVNALASLARHKTLRPCSVTSREDPTVKGLSYLVVDGNTVEKHLPWLLVAYSTTLRELASAATGEDLTIAENPLHSVAINVMRGGEMRYECHVDSNPIGCTLYTDTFCPGEGGEIVFSNRTNVKSAAEADSDASCLYPVKGQFYIFDGRTFPHYVRPVNQLGRTRVALVFNYYTQTVQEKDRPLDLDSHLFSDLE